MKLLKFAVIAASLLVASTASAEVQLTIQNGRVSLKAKDATLRQIMQEWARVGQTKVVNAERLPGGPMTLELNNVSEMEALDTLLRTVSGYVAAPRAVAVAGSGSRFDRILVMPTAAAPKQALSNAPPAPTFQAPMPQPVVDDDPDDAPGARPPIFGAFPQPQVGTQQFNPGAMPPGFQPPPGFVPPPGYVAPPNGNIPGQTGAGQPPTATPGTTNTFGAPTGTGPGGVAVPGMMVPVPQQQPGPGIIQPGQPVPPGRGRGGQ
jgi:hypothetical protein